VVLGELAVDPFQQARRPVSPAVAYQPSLGRDRWNAILATTGRYVHLMMTAKAEAAHTMQAAEVPRVHHPMEGSAGDPAVHSRVGHVRGVDRASAPRPEPAGQLGRAAGCRSGRVVRGGPAHQPAQWGRAGAAAERPHRLDPGRGGAPGGLAGDPGRHPRPVEVTGPPRPGQPPGELRNAVGPDPRTRTRSMASDLTSGSGRA
jgi:hypothetical protein